MTKKKTGSVKLTSTLCFNESLAFDVPIEQVRNLSFLVVVVAAQKDVKNDNDFNDGSHEKCLGKVLLGPKARSTGLQHFELSLQRPREQVVLWHVLR